MPRTHLELLLFVGLLAGCGVEVRGPGTPGTEPEPAEFSVAEFGFEGRRDICRDDRIEITFTAALDPDSLRSGSVRLIRRRGGREQPVSAKVQGDRLFLFPPEPFGLEPGEDYAVVLEGFPSLLAPRSGDGRPLDRGYRLPFSTGENYRPDLVAPRVEAIGVEEDLSGGWSVHARFSEPLDPSSVTAGRSFRVSTRPGGEEIPGRLISDRLSTWYRFLPGAGTAATGIHVSLTSGIVDLAGNPLADQPEREADFPLPGSSPGPSHGEILEDFTTDRMMDAAETTALWNGGGSPGTLLAEPATTVLPIAGGADGPDSYLALGAEATRFVLLLTREELGPAREITGIVWAPAGGGFVPAEYRDLLIRITPTTRESLSGVGFELDRPTTVLTRSPWRIRAEEWERVSVPFSESFPYDGVTNLILEIEVGAGDHTNFIRCRSAEDDRARIAQGDAVENLQPVLSLRSFSWTPVATSRFYDSGLENPEYLAPIVQPSVLSEGLSMTLSFQGARGLSPDGRSLPGDPESTSAWTEDPGLLTGYRYVRFRIEFRGVGLGEGDVAIDDLILPFRRAR